MINITANLLIGILGILGVLLSAEVIINKSKKIAKNFCISEFFIGLTVLSIGTSLPEISTHIVGSINILKGISPGIISDVVVGTNIGSNLIQITMITGIVGLFGILYTTKKFLLRDYVIMLSAILLLFLFALDKNISRLEGVILAFLYILYLIFITKKEVKTRKKIMIINKIKCSPKKYNPVLDFMIIFIGIAVLIYSSKIIVDTAVFFSNKFDISGSLIGALIIGVSTAIPELTTSIIALLKKSSGLSLGTLVGSNITNPMLALGIGAAISGYNISNSIVFFDLPFWFLVSIIAFVFFWRKLLLEKKEALVLISLYIIYVIIRIKFFFN